MLIGAENAVISNNRFVAQPKADSFKDVNIETVFVLFSANVSKHCLVTQNDMMASEALRRSYGVWVGSDAEATITDNTIRNTNYGVCLADGASALVCFNRFAVSAGPSGCPAFESFGITARGAKSVVDFDNTFDGVAIASQLPMLTSPTTPQVSGAPAD